MVHLEVRSGRAIHQEVVDRNRADNLGVVGMAGRREPWAEEAVAGAAPGCSRPGEATANVHRT